MEDFAVLDGLALKTVIVWNKRNSRPANATEIRKLIEEKKLFLNGFYEEGVVWVDLEAKSYELRRPENITASHGNVRSIKQAMEGK